MATLPVKCVSCARMKEVSQRWYAASVVPGMRVELTARGNSYYAVVARTFADARKGDVILYEDSYRNIALAISGGNAAELFGAAPGQEVRIRLRVP